MSVTSFPSPDMTPRIGHTCLADILLSAADQEPRSGMYFVSAELDQEAEFLSYPELLEEAQRILGGLHTHGACPGSKVILLLDRPRDFLPAFWSCVLGAVIPCPLAPIKNDSTRWSMHLAHVDTLLDRPLCVTTGKLLGELPASVNSVDLQSLRNNARDRNGYLVQLSDAALLMLTSGSTGNSKAVELTHGNLLASLEGRATRQGLTSNDTTFNWIAFDHVAALLESHMVGLYVAAKQVLTEPAIVLSDPLQFLNLIHRHRVSLAFAPNFFLGQVNVALQATTSEAVGRNCLALDLSCLRRIVTGGEANNVETGRRFLDLLAPYGLARNALWPAFGMTETCAACVYSHEFPDRDATREFATVGSPIAGLEVRIVNENGQNSPAGETGELQLRGPMVFNRYHNNEEATRAAFTADGWFRSGDVGRIEEGRLSLIARTKDSIIVSGVNYFSHELEAILERLDGIERSFVAAFPTRPKGADTEQLVVTFATTLQSTDEERIYELVVAVRNATIMLWGFRPALILPLPKSAFPKTSLGKIQRSLMRKRMEAGEFKADVTRIAAITSRQIGPYNAPEGPVEAGIADVFAAILGADRASVSTSVSFFDLGGTSLDILKLTQTLKKQFGLKDALLLVLQNPTVHKLAARIASKEKYRSSADDHGEYDPIVPLQLTGSKTPLFCVHPGNGEIFVLLNVAKYFSNERPFYALRPPGFIEGETHFKSVKEIITTYVSAILKRQPQGPYVIAGYSLGCIIAFELAKELEARGREVAFLGCIDFFPICEPMPLQFNMATGLALVLDLITIEQYEELNKRLRPELPSNEVCEYVLTFASPERLAELELDLQKFSVWSRVAHSVEILLLTHVTFGTLKRMTVFCSEGVSPRYARGDWSKQTWSARLRRWDRFISQPRYVEVPGTHHALMGPKYVATVQALLRSEIDLAVGTR